MAKQGMMFGKKKGGKSAGAMKTLSKKGGGKVGGLKTLYGARGFGSK